MSMQPAGFEPEISVSERQQTHALDRAAPGVGRWREKVLQNVTKFLQLYTVSLPKRRVYAASRKIPCVKDSKLSRRQNPIKFPETCCGI